MIDFPEQLLDARAKSMAAHPAGKARKLMPADFPQVPGMSVQNVDGVLLMAHNDGLCADEKACCIHNPSDHPMVGFRRFWRGDRGLMERICPHGVGHPDPDALAYKQSVMSESAYKAGAYDVHGCDGCC